MIYTKKYVSIIMIIAIFFISAGSANNDIPNSGHQTFAAIKPMIISQYPLNNIYDFPIDGIIKFKFSEEVFVNQRIDKKIQLIDILGNTIDTLVFSNSHELTIKPIGTLKKRKFYSLKILSNQIISKFNLPMDKDIEIDFVTNSELPQPLYSKLPEWKGFNLESKMYENKNDPYSEDDFKMITKLGFNFVRLAIHYKNLNDTTLAELDQVMNWAQKYKIHICLNLHTIPGWDSTNPDPELRDLWTNNEKQNATSQLWKTLAKKFKGIENKYLSFNLINEPAFVSNSIYVDVIKKIVTEIRNEDLNRLIISDGIDTAVTPVQGLSDLHIAQSGHEYNPTMFTQYNAYWIKDSSQFPFPKWPNYEVSNYLYGPNKPDLNDSIKINGDFKNENIVRFHLATVSDTVTLIITADNSQIFNKKFVCTDGIGEWIKSVYIPQYKIFQNIYDKDYEVTVSSGTKQIKIELIQGDWLSFTELSITDVLSKKSILIKPTENQLGIKSTNVFVVKDDYSLDYSKMTSSSDSFKNSFFNPWISLSKETGVIVGEFGVLNTVPLEDSLNWMADCLDIWKKADIGWAMWHFRGEFGLLNSNRKRRDGTSASYINISNKDSTIQYNLDVEMYKLLLRYMD